MKTGLARAFLAFWAVAGALLSAACPAYAEPQSEWRENDQGRVRLIAAVTGTGSADWVQLGLEFEPKPGWKIYWRSPGDAGYPPSLDWKGSENLAETVISWPAPRRFSVSGIETAGYEGRLVLPIVARLSEPGRALSVRAELDYLTCDVLCVPVHASLALSLAASPADPSPHIHRIGQFLARVPGNGVKQGIVLKSVTATPSGDLKVVVDADPPLVKPDLFVERSDQLQFSKPRVKSERGGRRVALIVTPSEELAPDKLAAEDVTITVVDGDRAMEASADVMPPEPGNRLGALFAMLGVAFLGGLILNVMPCVLPVLSIKLLAVLGSGGDRASVRAGFGASAAGIVASFLVLAAVLLTLRIAGTWIGWGIQFQQPVFLAAMTVVLVLFAANLWGLFEVPLPGMAADIGQPGRGRPLGHFAEGALATLLATPCTAPFVGTALGFALVRGPLEVLCIFLAMGIGMATPFLAVAAWPGLVAWLPRPGAWMVVVKRVMGLALLGTAGWLLSVLAVQSGVPVALIVAGMMVAALGTLAAGRRLSGAMRAAMVAVLALVALVAAGGDITPPAPLSGETKAASSWREFDPVAIPGLVARNKTVFVDLTADWCLTCKLNKIRVLEQGPVAARLGAENVVAMRGDWTRSDDVIAAFLSSFGRFGVPFNVVYGPGAPDGIVLPELLTGEAVTAALDAAARAPQ